MAVRAAGVVHRDIKPANVLLGRGRPFLIGFGIARAVRDPRHTQTGTVIGTPGYLAPEQATGAVAAAPADVFSLAAVLVYAATGRSPFLARGEQLELPGLLYRIVHEEPLLDGVPHELLALVGECLAKDPDRRPTAEEVLARVGAAGEEWSGAVSPDLVADVADREAALRGTLAEPRPPARPFAPAAAPPQPSFGPVPVAPMPPSTAPGTPLPHPAPAGRRRPHLVLGAAVLAAAVTFALTTPWAGTWTGVGPGTPDADGVTRARTGRFSVTVALNRGAVGDLVGRQVSEVTEVATGRNLGWTEALALRQVSGDRAVFAAATSHPTDPAATFDCPKGNLYVLTLAAPGRPALETEGARSAGAPEALTRSR
ncbi:protein kinase [Streptomyces sp. ICC1]|uniref:serine/threonine-protein kinase n=1 Tax=Streptomyces sp. ICC1 TaxID=2099583 RepID=UPI0013A6C6C6|nr:protein kinase [Streptomyces sp. ICC1]